MQYLLYRYESDKSLRKTRSTLQKIVAIIMLLAGLAAAASVTQKYTLDLSSLGRYGLLGGVQGMFLLLIVFTATRKDPKTDVQVREKKRIRIYFFDSRIMLRFACMLDIYIHPTQEHLFDVVLARLNLHKG